MDRQEMQADIVVTGFGPAAAGFLATIGPELAKTKEDGTPLYESYVASQANASTNGNDASQTNGQNTAGRSMLMGAQSVQRVVDESLVTPSAPLSEEEQKAQEMSTALAAAGVDAGAVVTKAELGDSLYYAIAHNDDDVIERDSEGAEVGRSKGYTLAIVAREPRDGEQAEDLTYRVPDFDDPRGTYDEGYVAMQVPWASFSGAGDDSFEYTNYDFRPYITRVILDDRITDLGDYALSDLTALAAVTLPQSIARIGAGTFAEGGEYGLTTVWPYQPANMTDEERAAYQPYTTAQLAALSREDLVNLDEEDQSVLAQQRAAAAELADEAALRRSFAGTPLFKAAYPQLEVQEIGA